MSDEELMMRARIEERLTLSFCQRRLSTKYGSGALIPPTDPIFELWESTLGRSSLPTIEQQEWIVGLALREDACAWGMPRE